MYRPLLLFFLIDALVMHSQSWRWSFTYGTEAHDCGQFCGSDRDGNIYLVSARYLYSSGRGANYYGQYFSRYTSAGQLEFSDSIARADEVVTDSVGNSLLLSSPNHYRIYDSKGRQLCHGEMDIYFTTAIAYPDGFVVSGRRIINNVNHGVIVAMNTSGSVLWEVDRFDICGSGMMKNCLSADRQGRIWYCGKERENGNENGNGDGDGKVVRISREGRVEMSFGTGNQAIQICGSSKGEVVVIETGGKGNENENEKGKGGAGKYQFGVVKYTLDGKRIWSHAIPMENCRIEKVVSDMEGNIYTGGNFREGKSTGFFVLKLNTGGKQEWLVRSKDAGTDPERFASMYTMAVKDKALVVTGSMKDRHQFGDKVLIGDKGNSDLFLGVLRTE